MLAAQSCLLENVSDNDLDPSSGSSQEGSTEQLVKPSVSRRRANLQEVENGYITVSQLLFLFLITTQKNPTLNSIRFVRQRVKEYLVGRSLVSKLQARHDQIKAAVEKGITSAFLTELYQNSRENCVNVLSGDHSFLSGSCFRNLLSFLFLFPLAESPNANHQRYKYKFKIF